MGFKVVLQEKQGLCGEMQAKDITQPFLPAFQCKHRIFILFDKDKASAALLRICSDSHVWCVNFPGAFFGNISSVV